MPEMSMSMAQAAAWLRESKRTVVLTGAGCSVDAGVPDFRSSSGWWRQVDPRTVATVEALEASYDLFHAFYAARAEHLDTVAPHKGHQILSDWEKAGWLHLLATQNVDGLHQLAGSTNVEELHGSIRSFRCHLCGQGAERERFLAKQPCACGGKLRPNVVLFGEALPEDPWDQTFEAILHADAVVVIGTSLQVSPVNQLPRLARGKLILINAEETGQERRFHAFLKGRAEATLVRLNEELLKH